ncbi:arylesterase [Halomonas sp. 1390]|uniref:arylesterase n=1 Tax=Halomonas sp. B23F22_3 TaxID=3459516 RepID=UPI00373F4D04
MAKGFPVNALGRQAALTLSALWLALVLMLAHATALAASSPVVLVMGDSLSAAYGIEQRAGWVSLLQARLDGKARVVNASISGETSSGAAARLPDLLGQHRPEIVVLELGGNDGLRGLPPGQMRANLAAMVEASQAADAEVLLLGIDIPPNYGQAYRDAFTGVFTRLADEHDLPLVPFLLEGVALDDELMQDDGIHPTAAAQPRILENVWPELAPLLEQSGVALAAIAQD